MITVEFARGLYESADSVHDFDHILRVWRLAERIALAEGAKLEVVRLAALLHDWGRAAAQVQGADHAVLSAARAEELLAEEPVELVSAVVHAIAAHRFRTSPDPETLEAQVLFDADKLDAIGAIGVARAFAYGGAQGQRLWVPLDEIDKEAADDPDLHTPVHEFVVKLSRIKGRLYTTTGKAIAAERDLYMRRFYQRLADEVNGER